MRNVLSILSATASLAFALVFIALAAAAIADTIGWRFSAVEITADHQRPTITQRYNPTE